MTTNQDVLKALTALAGHVRDDIREEIRQLRAHLHERFDRVDAHFDRLDAELATLRRILERSGGDGPLRP